MMASEGSSAVLALHDADEDTEAPNVSEDVEGDPLIMEEGYDIAVKVDAPMKQLSTLETYVTYRVRCVCARYTPAPASTPAHVRRRYNHFKALHKRLAAAYPLLAIPPLPPLHTAREQLDRYCPAFVAVRTMHLHAYLDRIAKHPILTHSEDFRVFLTTPDHQFQKVFKSESSPLSLFGFSLTHGPHAAEPKPEGVRVRDPEFAAMSEYLQSLQGKLTALCALINKLCKGTVRLGKEWDIMKRAASSWSTQAGGLTARACSAVSSGAGEAAGARQSLHPQPRASGVLPFIGLYAAALNDNIRQRDAMHAAHVGGSGSDELHNRLEQASEALRADLADWTPKTRHDLKQLLLQLADRQVNIHSQSLMGWERAMQLTSATSAETIFKTVSRSAVQNLSPTKCLTERASDELSTKCLIERASDELSTKCLTERASDELSTKCLTERASDELSTKCLIERASDELSTKCLTERASDELSTKCLTERASDELSTKCLTERASDELSTKCLTERASDELSTKCLTERASDELSTKCLTERASDELSTKCLTERASDELSTKCLTERASDELSTKCLTERASDELDSYNNSSNDMKCETSLERKSEKKTNEDVNSHLNLEHNGQRDEEFHFRREDKSNRKEMESKSKSVSDNSKVMSDPLHAFSEIDLSL